MAQWNTSNTQSICFCGEIRKTIHLDILLYLMLWCRLLNRPYFSFFFSYFLFAPTFPYFFMPSHKKWQGMMLYPSKFWVSICLSISKRFHHSCPLHNSDTVWDIFTKLKKKHKALCDNMQNRWIVTVVCLLLELLPFEHWTWNFSRMWSIMRQHAEHQNHDSG